LPSHKRSDVSNSPAIRGKGKESALAKVKGGIKRNLRKKRGRGNSHQKKRTSLFSCRFQGRGFLKGEKQKGTGAIARKKEGELKSQNNLIMGGSDDIKGKFRLMYRGKGEEEDTSAKLWKSSINVPQDTYPRAMDFRGREKTPQLGREGRKRERTCELKLGEERGAEKFPGICLKGGRISEVGLEGERDLREDKNKETKGFLKNSIIAIEREKESI